MRGEGDGRATGKPGWKHWSPPTLKVRDSDESLEPPATFSASGEQGGLANVSVNYTFVLEDKCDCFASRHDWFIAQRVYQSICRCFLKYTSGVIKKMASARQHLRILHMMFFLNYDYSLAVEIPLAAKTSNEKTENVLEIIKSRGRCQFRTGSFWAPGHICFDRCDDQTSRDSHSVMVKTNLTLRFVCLPSTNKPLQEEERYLAKSFTFQSHHISPLYGSGKESDSLLLQDSLLLSVERVLFGSTLAPRRRRGAH
ncbi:hypothetical protein F2P81_020459 [Scophthalmus maximus]|uniref:Uncharacterized protein n=1 Tax=Scophthalmus maximus TaxID=52904 RepID=A0A6A4S6A9_SCOMX|nr:hypothetical protein F2P81_020459 [Scophthalmus maximus]